MYNGLIRALTRSMYPLTAIELGKDFDLIRALRFGQLPVFTKRTKRRLVSHPKFYYFDVGVYLSIRPKGILIQQMN